MQKTTEDQILQFLEHGTVFKGRKFIISSDLNSILSHNIFQNFNVDHKNDVFYIYSLKVI